MPPTRAVGGGNFEDLMDEARAGDVVVFKRVRRAADADFGNGNTAVVIADVIFVTGDRKGEVIPAEKFIGRGITNELCKHPDGGEVCCVLGLKKRGDREYVCANVPSDSQFEEMERFWKEHGDDPWKSAKASSGGASDDDEAPF